VRTGSGSNSGSGSAGRRAWTAGAASGAAYPQPGERIDSFELEEPIGVGGMGAVFRARDTRLDREVALKLLPPEQAGDVEVVQRFYQEGRAAAQLDHENIARVYTIGHDANVHYIAFEFIEGTTIRQRVEQNGPLPVSEAINYTLQIAGALVHATERGVVHRDIKPSNIIVTPQGRAKLVDMGLARRFERGANDDGLTQSGMTLGTFDYISPEQARDPRDVDVRSDLYSLGCTLFQMLTGRPPFPDGTVLQKLIQHQEEPPPDICALNPQVPPDLGQILLKLMAKDRDRRYQTPEQLVRDLLTVAGTLGLRSISPEGLVWMSATAPAAWERHLVWALPALAFALVMIALVWWGQDTGAPVPHTNPDVLPSLSNPVAVSKPEPHRIGRTDQVLSARAAVPQGGAPEEAVSTAPVAARDIAVDSSEDLLGVLASAPPRSIVVLADDGPYLLGGESSDRHMYAQLPVRDLTIKADAGVVPTLRLARDALVGGKSPRALLDLVGGHVTLEGLEFVLETGDREAGLAAVRIEDTELTVRRCRFHAQGERTSRSPVATLEVHATAKAPGDRAPAVTIDACHFDGVSVGVLAQGPVEIQLRDCTLGGGRPLVWLDNGKMPSSAPPELRLRHVSVMAGEGPVFRFEGPAPRVWVDDSVIAPAQGTEGTLVAADDPDGLDWRGRGNLYGRIGVYLQSSAERPRHDPVRKFADWAETASLTRETGSTATQDQVWGETNPEQALAQEGFSPGRVFRLAATQPGNADVGARLRQGPFAVLGPAVKLATNLADGRRERESRPPSAVDLAPSKTPDAAVPIPVAEAPEPTPMPMPMPDPDESAPMPRTRMPEMPEMPVMPPSGREGVPARTGLGADSSPRPEDDDGAPASAPVLSPAPAPSANPGADQALAVAPDQAVLRTVEQLVTALTVAGADGGTLRIAADADWVLTGLPVRTGGRWTLRAEPGSTRPKFRFRPLPADPKAPTARSLALDLRAGGLHCEGIDLIMAKDDAPAQGRWGGFGVIAGTELSLTDCTVTIEGDEVRSAALVAQAPSPVQGPLHEADSGKDGSGAETPAARVLLTNCLLRSGGDLVEVVAGSRLNLELVNVIVATGGCMVHANGLPRGQAVAPLKLSLRQVTARMVGGLIQLESAPGEPELPLVEISARDSILATTAQGVPLLQVDGQDDLVALQNRIKWDGLRVAYHQINAYRRDQTAQVGTVPKIYNRPAWMVAVGTQEEAPIHGDVKFVQRWSPDHPAWLFRRDDFRLTADSPAASSGAELAQIPPAPAYPW
jgi:serine/threonine-protein kinase